MGATARTDPDTSDRRRYRSRVRDEQAAATKQAVLESARTLFLANGWSATGMRHVAEAAGVALETVYSHFSSKRGLLRAVADTAVVGDDAPVPLADRSAFRAIGEGPRPARIAAAAHVLTQVQVRTAGLARVLREAAPADPEIAEMLTAARERQRRDIAAALELIVGRPPTTLERDGVWAVASPEVYLLVVEQSDWAPEQYEAWIADTFDRMIPLA